MSEFFSKLNGGEIIVLVSVIGGLTVSAIAILASEWRQVRIAEVEASLKQQMLDKGMSASEIEQVMKSSQEPSGTGQTPSTGNEALDKAALVQRMVDNGYEGADIERVLKAYPAPKQTDAKPFVNQS